MASAPAENLIRAGLSGVGFVVWLVYAELFVIDAIWLWRTTVHVLTLTLFRLTALGTAATDETATTTALAT